jgi:hypothetical protein
MKASDDKKMRKYYNNMIVGNFYRKGERDSRTKQKVLAVRKGYNIFGPETCYFDNVDNLPFGVFYVDCE